MIHCQEWKERLNGVAQTRDRMTKCTFADGAVLVEANMKRNIDAVHPYCSLKLTHY